jgi:hypothetical protein
MNKTKSIIPEVPEYFHEDTYAKIFSALNRGENVQLVAIKGFGKSILLRNLEANQEKIKRQNNIKSDLSFYLSDLSLLTDFNSNTVVRHIFRDMIGREKIKSLSNEEIINEISDYFKDIRMRGKSVVIILDSMEKLESHGNIKIYNFLNGIHNENMGFIRYVFAFSSHIDLTSVIRTFGDFGRLIVSNQIFVRNLNSKESMWFLKSLESVVSGVKVDEKTQKEIIKISGGYLFAIKRLFESTLAGKNILDISSNPLIVAGLSYNIELILNSFPREAKCLYKIVSGQNINEEELTNLKKLYLIDQNGCFVSTILERYLLNKFKLRNKGNYTDIVGGVDLEIKLTASEHKIMKFLYNNLDTICSREEIIDEVWGIVASKGISDHAFDQMINRLRGKLHKSGKFSIETIYKRGHRLLMN